MTTTVDIIEAQTKLRELLELALEGNEVIIADGEKPMARLQPLDSIQEDRIPDLEKGNVWVSDDFDDPLSDEFLLGEE